MNAPLHLQQIVGHFLPTYQQHHRLSAQQYKVSSAISACRTAALGGQFVQCEHCGFEQRRYHSCRNRHCPQCQQRATEQWCERQLQRVLPVDYFHLVFTLPHELNPWVRRYPQVLYALVFQCAWATLKTLGADPKRLNGELGMTAVLHTWGQNLSQHVHLHCLIPGGALSHDHTQWHPAKSTYLFPVKVLSRLYRGKLVSALREAHRQRRLPSLTEDTVTATLDALMAKDWVVYSKATLHHATTVVKYLSRYTYKIAISEQRLIALDDTHVTFRWYDYRDSQNKCLRLRGEEFIRRFLQHVLPGGFMRIRHYGFLANRCREHKLHRIRQCLISSTSRSAPTRAASTPSWVKDRCPTCRAGTLHVRYEIAPKRRTGG
jgi:predicted Zn-ribbon and HTH transcriptional regulator